MGLTRDEAERCGIGHLYPDDLAPVPKAHRVKVDERGMNKTEAAWARRLDELKAAGRIKDYRFEAMKLRLAGRCWYTPDFVVFLPDGSLVIAEVKGAYIREDGMIKLKVAAEQLPFPFFLCVYAERRWTVTRLPSRSSRGGDIDVFNWK